MSLVDDLKARFNEIEPTEIIVEGLPPFYVKPITLGQAREIDAVTGTFDRIAKIFQVRAKGADGMPLVKPGELDDFKKWAGSDLITEAVSKMNEALSVEALEKNS